MRRSAADALGKRTHELRLPLQHSLAPAASVRQSLARLSSRRPGRAPQRIACLYDVLLPGLAARYAATSQRTDTLMDAPSVRIIDGILADQ